MLSLSSILSLSSTIALHIVRWSVPRLPPPGHEDGPVPGAAPGQATRGSSKREDRDAKHALWQTPVLCVKVSYLWICYSKPKIVWSKITQIGLRCILNSFIHQHYFRLDPGATHTRAKLLLEKNKGGGIFGLLFKYSPSIISIWQLLH